MNIKKNIAFIITIISVIVLASTLIILNNFKKVDFTLVDELGEREKLNIDIQAVASEGVARGRYITINKGGVKISKDESFDRFKFAESKDVLSQNKNFYKKAAEIIGYSPKYSNNEFVVDIKEDYIYIYKNTGEDFKIAIKEDLKKLLSTDSSFYFLQSCESNSRLYTLIDDDILLSFNENLNDYEILQESKAMQTINGDIMYIIDFFNLDAISDNSLYFMAELNGLKIGKYNLTTKEIKFIENKELDEIITSFDSGRTYSGYNYINQKNNYNYSGNEYYKKFAVTYNKENLLFYKVIENNGEEKTEFYLFDLKNNQLKNLKNLKIKPNQINIEKWILKDGIISIVGISENQYKIFSYDVEKDELLYSGTLKQNSTAGITIKSIN